MPHACVGGSILRRLPASNPADVGSVHGNFDVTNLVRKSSSFSVKATSSIVVTSNVSERQRTDTQPDNHRSDHKRYILFRDKTQELENCASRYTPKICLFH